MSFMMIAVIKNNDDIIGYRLLNTDSKECTDAAAGSVMSVITSGKASIENLKVRDGKIVGCNGALTRYTVIDSNGNPMGSGRPMVILAKIGETGFIATDYRGNCRAVSVNDAIRYSKEYGIANGKVVNHNGIDSISAIEGGYPTIKEKVHRKKSVKTAVNEEVNEKQSSIEKQTEGDSQDDAKQSNIKQTDTLSIEFIPEFENKIENEYEYQAICLCYAIESRQTAYELISRNIRENVLEDYRKYGKLQDSTIEQFYNEMSNKNGLDIAFNIGVLLGIENKYTSKISQFKIIPLSIQALSFVIKNKFKNNAYKTLPLFGYAVVISTIAGCLDVGNKVKSQLMDLGLELSEQSLIRKINDSGYCNNSISEAVVWSLWLSYGCSNPWFVTKEKDIDNIIDINNIHSIMLSKQESVIREVERLITILKETDNKDDDIIVRDVNTFGMYPNNRYELRDFTSYIEQIRDITNMLLEGNIKGKSSKAQIEIDKVLSEKDKYMTIFDTINSTGKITASQKKIIKNVYDTLDSNKKKQ